MIRLDSVTKCFGATTAVDSLDLSVAEGEVCVLVGPSGCGKTTTLKMINRLVEPTSGRILVADRDVSTLDAVELRRRIGYVIQQVGLFPHLRVDDNVATVPRLLGWDRDRIRRRTAELLELVGLDPGAFARRWPHELSGGQRQRVGVARALAADPPVLLMDEPFGAVDPVTRQRLQDELLRIQGEVAKTVVIVTHDVDEAVRLGDRVAVLSEGGRLEQHAEPAAVLGLPASAFVADFVGADRSLRRLATLRVDAARLEPVPDGGPEAAGGAVPVGASLREALVALLDAPRPAVDVLDGDRVVGRLTLDALRNAAASSQSGGSTQRGGAPAPGGSTRG